MGGESLSRRTFKIAGCLVLIGTFLGLAYIAADLFLLTFLAILLALGLRGLAGWITSHTRISMPWSLAGVSLILLGSVLLVGFLSAPRLAAQAEQLSRELPEIAGEAERKIQDYPMAGKIIERVRKISSGAEAPGKILSKATGIFSSTFGVLANLLFLAAMFIFLALEPRLYRDPFVRLFPVDRRKRIGEVLDGIGHALRLWLLGRVLSMLLIAVLTGLGLWWLGVPLALLLAVIAGLLNFIPNIGPILALVPAILLTFPMGFQTVALVVGLYTAVQFLESYVFTPIIQKKAIDLPEKP